MKTDTMLDSKEVRGNHQSAFDWPYVLWSWITLNWHTSRSSKLHVRYRDNGDRCNDCVNRSWTGNHPCATDWNHTL